MPPILSQALSQVRDRLRNILRGEGDAHAGRVQRRRALLGLVNKVHPFMRVLLLVAGYLWLLLLPSQYLGRGVYIDENALQPAQVSTYWDWRDVHRADSFLADLERLREANASSTERAHYLKLEFEKLGIHSATQSYRFSTPHLTTEGVNAYAVLSTPRTPGSEAIVLSASWLSYGQFEDPNLRGVATLLALASFLKRYSHWARDIVFVASDGMFSGMQAWLSAYHDETQTNVHIDPLILTSGVIWNALHIDYPGHSFSHLGVFYEGRNGRLPNQDLINAFRIIAINTGRVPVTLYDIVDEKSFPAMDWIPTQLREKAVIREFLARARNIFRHVVYQGSGLGSGVHALYHKYRIDAITIFAVPATGPYGFYHIGMTIESTLRTLNNLLERLHASFFFYIMTSTTSFHKMDHYLPAVIMISVGTMLKALALWVDAGWRKEAGEKAIQWVRQSRAVLGPLLAMLCAHTVGVLGFYLSSRGWIGLSMDWISIFLYEVFLWTTAVHAVAIVTKSALRDTMSGTKVFESLIFFTTSTLVSVMSLLNFSLAMFLCFALILPMVLLAPAPSNTKRRKEIKSIILTIIATALFAFGTASPNLINWQTLGVWIAPLICIVCVPFLLQMAVICLLH